METFGKRLYSLRKKSGLSQEELAEMTGVSRQTIYKWESDMVLPNGDNLTSLCESLSVEKAYFFGEACAPAANGTLPAYGAWTPVCPCANCPCRVAKRISVRKKFIASIVLLSIVVIGLALFTTCIGFITLTTNRGDISYIHDIWNSTHFYIFLVLTALLFILDIFLIVKAARKKNKLRKKL